MSTGAVRRVLAITIIGVLFPVSALAIDENVAVLRIESLDAVLSDVERVAALAGTEIDHDQILEGLRTSSGLPDLSWLDRSKPLVIVFPLEGMALGDKGLVAAFPLESPDAAFKAIGEGSSGVDVDDQGIREFTVADGRSVVVSAREGYLIAGQSKDLVTRFEPSGALEISDLPPGNIALDVFLEPVAPMALMGLQMGRQVVENKMKGHTETPQDEDIETPELDPETAAAFVGLYFDLIRDALTNTSRIQLSLEVGSEFIVLHKRLTPRAGSTFDGLVRAQKGGMPELARYVETTDTIGAAAGQFTFTPEFIEAIQGYIHGYMNAMNALAASSETSSEPNWYAASLQLTSGLLDRWPECYRGDFASTFALGDEGGFQATQILGTVDPEACRGMITDMATLAADLPPAPDGEPMVTLTENALEHKGIQAWRQETHLVLPEQGDGDEMAQAFWETWFGASDLVSYSGLVGEYMVSETGPRSEERFKALVDRLTAKKKVKAKMAGLTPETFDPIDVGPGAFMTFDLGLLAKKIGDEIPTGDDGKAAMIEFLRNIPEGAVRIIEGLRFETNALHVEIAAPLDFIEVVGDLIELSETLNEEHRHEHEHDTDAPHDHEEQPDPATAG